MRLGEAQSTTWDRLSTKADDGSDGCDKPKPPFFVLSACIPILPQESSNHVEARVQEAPHDVKGPRPTPAAQPRRPLNPGSLVGAPSSAAAPPPRAADGALFGHNLDGIQLWNNQLLVRSWRYQFRLILVDRGRIQGQCPGRATAAARAVLLRLHFAALLFFPLDVGVRRPEFTPVKSFSVVNGLDGYRCTVSRSPSSRVILFQDTIQHPS